MIEARDSGGAERAALQERGFFVGREAIEPEACAAALAAVESIWADRRRRAQEAPARDNDYARAHVRPELQRVHRLAPELAALCHHPAFQRLGAALIGPDVDVFWNQAHVKAGGSHAQTTIPWHQDAAFVTLDREPVLSVWIALTEVPPASGPLLFGPGSHDELRAHRWNEKLAYYICPAPTAPVAVPLARGQMVVFDWRCVHGSEPNRSQRPRVGYSVSIAPRAVRVKGNGELFGDQVPLLRGGHGVAAALLEVARGETVDEARREAARIALGDIAARVGQERTDAAFAELAAVSPRRDAALYRLLALAPDDHPVNGDLLASRTDVAAIVREASTLSPRDRSAAIRLLERALVLDPRHEPARELLAMLTRTP